MSIIDFAIRRLSQTNCSEHELRQYLEKEFKALPALDARIDSTIKRLRELEVLNDARLASHLAQHYTHKGNCFIVQLLKQKGIEEIIIDEVLHSLEDEPVRALHEARKKLGYKWHNTENDINELHRFLGGRRFSHTAITSVVGQLENQQRRAAF